MFRSLGAGLILLFISPVLFATELTDDERLWLQQHPVINFAPAPYYPPVEYFDESDTYRGITADFVELMSQRLDINLAVKKLPSWHHVVEGAKSGSVDVWGAAAYTDERDRYMDFTQPYIRLPAVLVVRKEQHGPLNMRDLQGKRVVLIKNYASAGYVKETYPGLDYIEVPDLETGLRMVSYSLADAIVATNAAALFYIERDGLSNLRVAGESGYEWQLRFAVREEYAPLVGIIQKGLDLITEEEKRTIYRRWINLESSEPMISTERLFQLGLLVGLVLMVLVFVWNRTLSRKVLLQTRALNAELEERKALESNLRRLATTDDLTGIMNRRQLFATLRRELKRSERYGESIALLMFDVDRFKEVNDQYGHASGDLVLQLIVDTCSNELREHDLFGRIGGEEFAIALLQADEATALAVAQRLCDLVAACQIGLADGERLQTSISVGVVYADNHTDLEELLSCCDRAMYTAKQKGRNRVECFNWRSPEMIV